jgi:signal transduction histidine kinase
MDPRTKAAIADAVNTLVGDIDAKTLYTQMQGVLDLAARGIPVQLVGRPAVLNPLIDLALADEEKYERVMELVDRKRTEASLAPLMDMELDRKAYMREFMAVRRERLRRLVELWNELRSEHDKIRGSTRLDFEQLHAARWKEEKDRRETLLRQKLGRRLTMPERQSISAQLWEEVDAELNQLDAFVRSELRKPLRNRSKDGFKFTVGELPKKGKV